MMVPTATHCTLAWLPSSTQSVKSPNSSTTGQKNLYNGTEQNDEHQALGGPFGQGLLNHSGWVIAADYEVLGLQVAVATV